MSDLPLVSVIMPAFNRADYITEALESVLGQDYPHKELVVIDDGSTDNTIEIVKSFGNRVRLMQQRNSGPAAARNRGIGAAAGKYVAFIDSDDVWLPGKLTAQVGYLEANPDVSVVHAELVPWSRGADGVFQRSSLPEIEPVKATIAVDPSSSGWIYHRLLLAPMVNMSSMVVRRSLFEEIGLFDVSLLRGEDYEFTLRASRVTRIEMLDCVAVVYRRHSEQSIKHFPSINYELKAVGLALERWGLCGPDGACADADQVDRRLAESSFNFAYYHFWNGNPWVAFRSFLNSLRRVPTRPKAWAYLFLSASKALLRSGRN